MTRMAKPRAQRAEPRATVNHSQEVRLNPNQEIGSICSAKFQSCFGMATLGFLPFSPIKKQFRAFLSLFHYCMLGMWGAENLSFQVIGLLGKEELHSRSCTQGTAHRSLVFTRTTFIWQDLHDLTWCYKGLIVESLSWSKEYFSCWEWYNCCGQRVDILSKDATSIPHALLTVQHWHSFGSV